MVDAEINFKNKAEILGRLNFLKTQVDQVVERTASFFILTGRSEIQKNLYPNHGYITGNLRSSYQGEIVERGECTATIKLWTTTTYASAVEYGNGGRVAHFRPGIQITITLAREYFREQMEGMMK